MIKDRIDEPDFQDLFYRIYEWNRVRDNLNYNSKLEIRLIVEELLEFIGLEKKLCKDLAVKIADFCYEYADTNDVNESIDALGDLLFIIIGSIWKRGYDPYVILKRICDHNDNKGINKDSGGKIIKDINFIEPIHD
jgi:predicted HAD superfamily Cof-like phosphohydrolase